METAISETAIGAVASAIFAVASPSVLEAYSEPDQELRRFCSREELLGYVAAKRAACSSLVHLAVWYPEMLGQVEVTRFSLDPTKCDGHTFRYRADGWGLIFVQLHLAASAATSSSVSANSLARAERWAPTFPELQPPSSWAWQAVSRHTRRLTRALRTAD